MDAKLIQRGAALAVGVGAGVALGVKIRADRPSTEEQAEAKADGRTVVSAPDTIAKIAMPAMITALGIGGGCLRAANPSTAGGLATAMLAGGAFTAGAAVTALTNSDGSAERNLNAIGVAGLVGTAGFVAGRYGHAHGPYAAIGALGLLGLSAGMVVPWALGNYATSF